MEDFKKDFVGDLERAGEYGVELNPGSKCTPNGITHDEYLENWISIYGLPSLLENISSICEETAKQYRSDLWLEEDTAKDWDKAAKAIDEATSKAWATIEPVSVGDRGCW